jgi:hypothetical protein
MQALRSLETGLDGWSLPKNWKRRTRQQVEYGLRVPNPERMLIVKQVTLLCSLSPACMPVPAVHMV